LTQKEPARLIIEANDKFVDWDKLVIEKEPIAKQTKRGCPDIHVIYMLKSLFLQYLYDLSDPQLEDSLFDRISFQRFLGISFKEELPDYSTIWRFRECLIKSGMLDKLFERIVGMSEEWGFILSRGAGVDVSFVVAACRPVKQKGDGQGSRQRAKDAAYTRQGKKTYYGLNTHIGMDEGSEIIRRASFTPANVHDSQELDHLISNNEGAVFGDKGYFDTWTKRYFRQQGVYCGILDRATRRGRLPRRQRLRNYHMNRSRSTLEHILGQFKRCHDFNQVMYVTKARNRVQFLFLYMIYNIRQDLFLMAAMG